MTATPFRFSSLSAFLIVLSVFLLTASVASAQQKESPLLLPKEEIVDYLTSEDRSDMVLGLNRYVVLPEEERTPELREALVEGLRKENERRRAFHLSDRSYLYEGDDTSALALVGEVKEWRDPAYIDVLLPWLCCGSEPVWIDFGREVFRPILDFVYAAEPGYENSVIGGIGVLRIMVDYWGLDSFSDDERERMRQVVLRHISGEYMPERWDALSPAIVLAYSLGEADLLHVAQDVVNDEDELRRRGITYDDGMLLVRERLSKALAGTLKFPQYEDYLEWKKEVEQEMMEFRRLQDSE